MSEERKTQFWQVNLGHILTMTTVLSTLSMMYGRLSNTIEGHTVTLHELSDKVDHLESNQTAMAIADAATVKDLADIHTSVEQDLVRRLNKDEDILDALRDGKVH